MSNDQIPETPVLDAVQTSLRKTVVVVERVFRFAVETETLDSEDAQRVASQMLQRHLSSEIPSLQVERLGSKERIAAVLHNRKHLLDWQLPDAFPYVTAREQIEELREFEREYRTRLGVFLTSSLKQLYGPGKWVKD